MAIDIIYWECVAVSIVAFGFLMRALYALVMAVAHRVPSTPWWKAINGLRLFFGDNIYTAEGLMWAKMYRQCVVAFVACWVVGVIICFLTNVLFYLLGWVKWD